MKKILIISPYYKEKHRWMVSTYKYAENLAKHAKIIVFTGRSRKTNPIIRGKNLKIFGFRDIFIPDPANYGIIPFMYLRLYRLIKQENPDHIIINKHMFHTALCSILLKFMGRKFILSTDTFPGYVWWSKSNFVNLIIFIYSRTIGNLALKLADKVIIFHKGLIKTSRKLKLNYRVIPNGVNFKEIRSHKKVKLRKNRDELIIGYVGRLESVKNYQDLVDVAKRFDKNIKFVFIGDISGKEKYVEDNKSENIVFLGYKKNVISYMKDMDIFVLPSKSEGLSNALMEAMATKTSCVVSNVGGNKILVNSDAVGRTFKTGNKKQLYNILNELIKNKKLRNDLAKNAYYRIRLNFNWDKISKQILSELV